MSEIRSCTCGKPCGACVQAEEISSSGVDVGCAVVAGSLVGAYAAWMHRQIWSHLCPEHSAVFNDGLRQLRELVAAERDACAPSPPKVLQ